MALVVLSVVEQRLDAVRAVLATPTPARSSPSPSPRTTAAPAARSDSARTSPPGRQLRHVRTRARTPGQNGVRERALQSLKYERLYRQPIDDVLDLVSEAEAHRVELNTIRPHEALAWKNRPLQVHTGLADLAILIFPEPETLPTP